MGWVLSAQVVLHHPFMLHTSSPNPSGVPRFITNPVSTLKEPMQFSRLNEDHSALEASILQALEMNSLDFSITRERKRSEGFSRMDDDKYAEVA